MRASNAKRSGALDKETDRVAKRLSIMPLRAPDLSEHNNPAVGSLSKHL